MKTKQILRVLVAVQQGARTSNDVTVVTGLSLKHCCAYLRELEHARMVRRSGRLIRGHTRKSIVWCLTDLGANAFRHVEDAREST